MSQKVRDRANRNRKNERVEKDDLVWVRSENPIPGTSRKLNVKWIGPYKVSEVIRGGSAYKLLHLLENVTIQRAADKINKRYGQEEWLLEPQEKIALGPHS